MKLSAVVVMFQLTSAVAMLLLHSHMEENVGEAVSAVLETTSQPSCSLILLTDGVTSLSTILKAVSSEEVSPWGISVFEMVADTLDTNKTLAELTRLVGKARLVRLGSWCVSVVVVSHDPAFLAAFAESSLKGRLLVWATRLLVVTSLTLPQLHALLPDYWTFSMMNAIFLNLEDRPSNFRMYTYLPYSPDGAQVVKVAIWSPKRGIIFLGGLSLFPEKFVNFHGATVNITILPWPPYWDMVEEKAPNGTIVEKYTGSDYLAFKTAYEELNFVFHIIPTASWDEVLEKMIQRESFVVPVYEIIFPERAKRYDFTHLYEMCQATFSMAKPKLKPRWQGLYYPLTNDVWIAVLAVLLIMPVIIYVVMGILVSQNLPLRLPNISSSRLLVAAWLVFAFIIGTVYRGNLTAHLTLPKYPPRPETVEQLVDIVDSVTMPSFGGDWLTFFAASDSEVYKKLAKLMVIGPGTQEGLQMATEQNTAPVNVRRYMANVVTEHFTQADGSTPLYLAQETIFPGPSGWPIPHDAPYKAQLDRCLVSIIEAGLYEKWSADLLRQTRQRSRQRQRQNLAQQPHLEEVGEGAESGSSITALTLTHMQGPLMLLLLGLILAGMTFIGNIIVIRCMQYTGTRPHKRIFHG